MKRMIVLMLALLSLSLLACSNQEQTPETTQPSETVTEVEIDEATAPTESTPVSPISQGTPLQSNGSGCAGDTSSAAE